MATRRTKSTRERVKTKKVRFVECSFCGAHHYADAGTFIVLRGYITKGLNAVILGKRRSGEPLVICLGNCIQKQLVSKLKYDAPPPPPPTGTAGVKFFNGGYKARKRAEQAKKRPRRRSGVKIAGTIVVN